MMASTGANGSQPPIRARDEAQLLYNLLGPLHVHFAAADQAYRDYLKSGKSFLFACSLRRTNASARSLLLAHGYLLPEPLQADALALLRHYDVWLTLWDDLKQRSNPSFNDPFVFANSINFPVESRGRLAALHRELSA